MNARIFAVLLGASLEAAPVALAQPAPPVLPPLPPAPSTAPPATTAPAPPPPASTLPAPPATATPTAPPATMAVSPSSSGGMGLREAHRWFWHPAEPGVSLSAGSDGSNTARANLTFQADSVNSDFTDGAWAPIVGLAIVPTFSATDNSKKGLFSISPSSSSPTFGVTSISFGLMVAYTIHTRLRLAEGGWFTILSQPPLTTKDDIDACDSLCAGRQSDPADSCKAYSEQRKPFSSSEIAAHQLDPSSLCASARQRVKERYETVHNASKAEQVRTRFPVLDLSVWGGGGASQFTYYDQQTATVGTTLPTYASATQWQPSGGAAFALNAVPLVDGDSPHGLTLEAAAYYRAAYQASSATGMGCTGALGTVTTDKSPTPSYLGQCGTSQPIGGPTFGHDLVVEGYVGWVDVDNEYGRIAIGVGVDQNFLRSITTTSIKLPIYVNGTAPAKDPGSAKTPGGGIQAFNYDGIVRLTPMLTYTSNSSGKSTGWGAGVAVDVIGNHNLFVRADSLVK
jgi:hypothetical protein